MARNAKTRLLSAVAGLNASALAHLATFVESVVDNAAAEDLTDVETSVRSSRRSRKAKPAAAEAKPTRRSRRAAAEAETEEKPTRRRRGAAKAEPEAEKPTRRSRRGAKAETVEAKPTRTRRVKVEAFEDAPTMEDAYNFLEAFEGEPASGTIAELKTRVEELGGDAKALLAGLSTASEKKTELGMFIAASEALIAKLAASEVEDLEELADEVDSKTYSSSKRTAKEIVIALNTIGDDEDADEDEDEGDEDEDDLEGDEDDADEDGDEDEDGLEDLDELD